MAPEEGDPLQKKLAANQGPKPTSYTRTYLLSSQVAKSQRCCLGAVGFVYNEQVRNEGWKAGLMELGIEMSVEEVNKLPRDELLALSSRVMETKGFRQMLEYVKEAVKPYEESELRLEGVPESAWAIPEDLQFDDIE